jgi:hypothetical protein
MASLNGEGVIPPAGDGGTGEFLPGVYGIYDLSSKDPLDPCLIVGCGGCGGR